VQKIKQKTSNNKDQSLVFIAFQVNQSGHQTILNLCNIEAKSQQTKFGQVKNLLTKTMN